MSDKKFNKLPELRKIRVSIAYGRLESRLQTIGVIMLLLLLTAFASVLTYLVTHIGIYLIYALSLFIAMEVLFIIDYKFQKQQEVKILKMANGKA